MPEFQLLNLKNRSEVKVKLIICIFELLKRKKLFMCLNKKKKIISLVKINRFYSQSICRYVKYLEMYSFTEKLLCS